MKPLLFSVMLLLGIQFTQAQGFDYNVLKAWNIDRSRSSDGFFKFFSNQNTVFIIGVPAGMAIEGFLSHNEKLKTAALQAGVSLAVSSLVDWGLKYSINRQRPFDKYPDVIKLSTGGSPSFPSGHVSSAFSVATSISLSYSKWYVIIPAYAWAGTVAVSRVALGVHYPTDVIGGAVVGAGSAILSRKITKWLQHKARTQDAKQTTAYLLTH